MKKEREENERQPTNQRPPSQVGSCLPACPILPRFGNVQRGVVRRNTEELDGDGARHKPQLHNRIHDLHTIRTDTVLSDDAPVQQRHTPMYVYILHQQRLVQASIDVHSGR